MRPDKLDGSLWTEEKEIEPNATLPEHAHHHESRSLPEGFAARMQRLLGEEYPAFLDSYQKPLRASLRLNALRWEELSRKQALSRLPFPTSPIPWTTDGYYYPANASVRPGKHPYHEAGLYYIQEASAMLPASLCPPTPGDRVLDLCAAPGGKATQLASALRGKGFLVANEIHSARAAILAQNMERMGIANALITNEAPDTLAQRFPTFFDKIVVDAPCSGEGMFRKEPQAMDMWSQANIDQCAAQQDRILDAAARMLRPGGYLTYSTCTFAPEENEGSLLRFLRRHPDFDTVDTEAPAVRACLACGLLDRGQPAWVDAEPAYADALRRAIRLFPHHADGEGHFAVLLRKRPDATPPAPSPVSPHRAAQAFRKTPPPLRRAGGRALSSGADLTLCTDFLREVTGHDLAGTLHRQGDKCLLLPPDGIEPDEWQGLHFLRAGIELGSIRKDRFEPAHALAMALHPSAIPERTFALDAASGQAAAFLHGDTIPCPAAYQGWYLISLDGLPLGWGKASGGVMKNHYPKGLRKSGLT